MAAIILRQPPKVEAHDPVSLRVRLAAFRGQRRQNGRRCPVPVYGNEHWTLRGPIPQLSLPINVVATAKARGFCLLDTDELRGIQIESGTLEDQQAEAA
jgi:hypothetical protein